MRNRFNLHHPTDFEIALEELLYDRLIATAQINEKSRQSGDFVKYVFGNGPAFDFSSNFWDKEGSCYYVSVDDDLQAIVVEHNGSVDAALAPPDDKRLRVTTGGEEERLISEYLGRSFEEIAKAEGIDPVQAFRAGAGMLSVSLCNVDKDNKPFYGDEVLHPLESDGRLVAVGIDVRTDLNWHELTVVRIDDELSAEIGRLAIVHHPSGI